MRLLLLVALLCISSKYLAAQEVRTAVVPQTIHVGDVFQVVVRVVGARGAVPTFPDSLALPTDLESAGPRRLRPREHRRVPLRERRRHCREFRRQEQPGGIRAADSA